jgi:hypothetical protein
MEEVQIQTALLGAGVLTVDEVRAMRGLDPLAPVAPLVLLTQPTLEAQ